MKCAKILIPLVTLATSLGPSGTATAQVIDTGQSGCYDDDGWEISCPAPGQPFYGQDAQHQGIQPTYADNGDGTVTDLNTGLMWIKTPNLVDKSTWDEAMAGAVICTVGNYSDWRLPTIKELYSLINFDGWTGMDAASSNPYLDTGYFDFVYGDTSAGERFIDAQYCSSTEYVSTVFGSQDAIFGVNFADGRIKGYPKTHPDGGEMRFFVRYVRGNPDYGINDLEDNLDGTITDHATNLMWSQADSGTGLNWEEALAWVGARNGESYLGYSDWRLPNAKELQSIVDYTRSPDTSASPAIDPIFNVTAIVNAGGQVDYSYYWTGTTHLEGISPPMGNFAAYVSFGRALGWMEMPPGSGNYQLLDVHGAGAQRSDPKNGDPDNYPYGHGPQGDVIRIYNFCRLVRDTEEGATSIFADGFESGATTAWSSTVP